jgi:hypothetical protein
MPRLDKNVILKATASPGNEHAALTNWCSVLGCDQNAHVVIVCVVLLYPLACICPSICA